MAVTVPIDLPSASPVAPTSAPHRESYIHFLARECRMILRWVVVFLAVTTAVTFGTLFYWAVLPGILLLIAYSMLMFANSLESSTRRPGDPGSEPGAEQAMMTVESTEELPANPTDEEKHVINAAIWARLTKIGIAIGLGVAVLAVILAGVVFGGELLVLGTFILFAYMLLVAAPLWLGWLEDEAEEVVHKVEHELHPERA